MDRNQVVFRIDAADVSAIRFGVSPGYELCWAVRVLLNPAAHPLQWGWLRQVRDRVPRAAFGLLSTVIGPKGYFPDFLTTSPTWDVTPTDEIDRIRVAPPDVIRKDLAKMVDRSRGRRQVVLSALRDDPTSTRGRLADAWEQLWDTVVAPYWDQLQRLLRADIAFRVRRTAASGLAATIDSLHDRVSWHDDAIVVAMLYYSEVLDCAGDGVVLVPSVLGPTCSVLTEKPVHPTLFYPAVGITETWIAHRDTALAALTRLMGDGRARTLLCLDAARSTTEVAKECDLAISTASHHLGVLRAAALITSRRTGHQVLHSRTPLGDTLAGN